MGNPVFAPQMLRKDVRGEFIEAEMRPRQPYLYELYATIMNSTARRENYAWLDEFADLEEFADQVALSQILDTGLTAETGKEGPGYEIENKTYAGGLLFKRDDLADDQVGGYKQRIMDMTVVADSFPDREMLNHLVNGTSYTCYLKVGATAEAFFSATHAARGKQTATWSNLLNGSGTDVANLQTDITAAVSAFYKMRNKGNRLMNQTLRQFFVLCPVALKGKMRTAVYSAIISQTSNVEHTDLDITVVPVPQLDATSAVDWYFGSYDPGYMRGLIWQEREGVQLEEVGEGSELWSNHRQMMFAVTRRGAPGFGLPERLIKVNNTE